jgi:antitoxin VapB
MALFIRDDAVDALADELKQALNAPSKKDAVRTALQHELDRVRRKGSFSERIKRAQAIADAIGPSDPDFDMKKFTDEMWGDI